MKTLAEFLAEHIAKQTIFNSNKLKEMLCNAIEAYKKHLQNDSSKTVHWAMIERDLIIALERMQSKDSLEGAIHNNQLKIPSIACIDINVPRSICEFPGAYSKETNCKTCPLK